MVHLQLRERPAVNETEKIRCATPDAQRVEDSAPVVVALERGGAGAIRRAMRLIKVIPRSLSQAFFSRKTPRRVSEQIACAKTESSWPLAAMGTRKVAYRDLKSARMARTRKGAAMGELLMAD
jgi:hypothetical protein